MKLIRLFLVISSLILFANSVSSSAYMSIPPVLQDRQVIQIIPLGSKLGSDSNLYVNVPNGFIVVNLADEETILKVVGKYGDIGKIKVDAKLVVRIGINVQVRRSIDVRSYIVIKLNVSDISISRPYQDKCIGICKPPLCLI